MGDVSKGEGRTVLFVSHNMAAVKTLCTKGILLNQGKIEASGLIEEVAEKYFEKSIDEETSTFINNNLDFNKPIQLISAEIINIDNVPKIKIDYIVNSKVTSVVAIKIVDFNELPVITLRDNDIDQNLINKNPGKYSVEFIVPIQYLAPNRFKITFSFSDMKSERFDYHQDLLTFSINEAYNNFDYSTKREGLLLPYNEFIGKTVKNH
jgi:lipopolysaccharide transport system ATP-binding protein